MNVLYAGLVVWFATYILVESELFRPLREWVAMHEDVAEMVHDSAVESEPVKVVRQTGRTFALWRRARYLIGCHTCAGTWVGFAVAAALPGVRPLGGGVVGFVLAGLVFKAVGHLVLVLHKLGESLADR